VFACVCLADGVAWKSGADRSGRPVEVLSELAGEWSPRFEWHGDRAVVLDAGGLERLVGDSRTLGHELRSAAASRGLVVRVAMASTRMAAKLLAHGRHGLTVVPPGHEAEALAQLPLGTLAMLGSPRAQSRGDKLRASGRGRRIGRPEPGRGTARHYRLAPTPGAPVPTPGARSLEPDLSARWTIDDLEIVLATIDRWGLRTLGDLAALPAPELFERMGDTGLLLQRAARGEDLQPLVPVRVEPLFEETLDLEWPIDALEPLSFVLGRLLDPLTVRLAREDRGAAAIETRLVLVTRDLHVRRLELPAPFRDPRVLRTLILLDLESHPPPAGIDRVTVAVEPVPGRVLQYSLLERALPAAEQLSTLMARLRALAGAGRAGAPALVDSHHPGAFELAEFTVTVTIRRQEVGDRREGETGHRRQETRQETGDRRPRVQSPTPKACLRRFRPPVPVRVTVERGRPIWIAAVREKLAGRVVDRAGPWRSSGHWWMTSRSSACPRWDRDEWDIGLDDGGVYRIFQDREQGEWFIDGVVD
jgi:protein ImuB